MKSCKHRRYHSPDRRPIIGVAVELEWDEVFQGKHLETHCSGQGRYHSLDGKKPIAFTMNDGESLKEDVNDPK